MLRDFEGGIVHAGKRIELVEGVELVEGQTGLSEYLFLGHDLFEGLLHHAVGHMVAVVDRDSAQVAVFVDESEIHAPGVNAYGVQLHARVGHLHQRLLHVEKQPGQVPYKAAVHLHGIV